jgi:hypothetical protein
MRLFLRRSELCQGQQHFGKRTSRQVHGNLNTKWWLQERQHQALVQGDITCQELRIWRNRFPPRYAPLSTHIVDTAKIGHRLVPRMSLDEFFLADMRSEKDEKKDFSVPSTLSTLTHRPGQNALPLVPLVVGTSVKKPLTKQNMSTSHLEFLQLRFEDGKAEVECVTIPMGPTIPNKIKSVHSSNLKRSGFVGVQHVRVRLANSAA